MDEIDRKYQSKEVSEAEILELKVAAPLKISEVLVLTPPVQKVVCFSVSVPVPQKTVVIPITTPLIQRVTSLQIASPAKIITLWPTQGTPAPKLFHSCWITIGSLHHAI